MKTIYVSLLVNFSFICHLNSQDLDLPRAATADSNKRILKLVDYESNSLHSYTTHSLIDMIYSNSIQDQIEFSPTQKKQFAELAEGYRRRLRELFEDNQTLKSGELSHVEKLKRSETVKMKSRKLLESFNVKTEKLLVPRQLEILKAVQYERSVQSVGFSSTLLSAKFKKTFNLTKEQELELKRIEQSDRKKYRKAYDELQKQIDEIRAESRKKIMRSLSANQKKSVLDFEQAMKNSK